MGIARVRVRVRIHRWYTTVITGIAAHAPWTAPDRLSTLDCSTAREIVRAEKRVASERSRRELTVPKS